MRCDLAIGTFGATRILKTLAASAVVAGVVVCGMGCSGRATLLPNSDPSLRKTETEFAADAAKRFPYKANAPQGGEIRSRAEVGYMLNRIELTNLAGYDWNDFEVWINQSYVLHMTQLKNNEDRTLALQMFFNDAGHYYPTSGSDRIVKTIEIYMGGKMYQVKVQTAD